MTNRPTIAVWFSCGAASAAALKLTVENYASSHSIRAINNPVVEEHPDNRRFLQDVSDWCGIEIEEATNHRFPERSACGVWDKKKAMSFPHGAPCTVELKKRARQQWEKITK